MHLLQQVASGRAGGRDSGGADWDKAVCFGGFFFVLFFHYSNPHTGGVGGHPVIQCDDDDDDVPQPRHKRDVFSEDHAVVMATGCVLGNGLNTARLGGGKKREKENANRRN